MRELFKKYKKISIIIISLFIIFLVGFFINLKNGKAVDSGDRIHFISNGIGDSMIIESNGHYGLVDSLYPSELNGEQFEFNGTTVLNYAKALGVEYFDFVIMTHNHSDHIGGIPELAELFNNQTIVFYKEDKVSYNSNNDIDDFEELADGGTWKNHELYELAISTFNSKGSILCDILKENQSVKCDLSSTHNNFISSVTYDSNSYSESGSNMKEFVHFTFGDFDINLYNLNLISYHTENYNSIITLLTHKTGGATAVLTGDIEAGIGDKGFSYLSGKSNLIMNPTGNCYDCTTLGLENQMADIIGQVTLLKSAHHGTGSSDSYYALTTYMPKYFITQGKYNYDETHGYSPYYTANSASIILLNALYDTESYFSGQATGAVVAQFNDDSDDTLGILRYNYGSNNTLVIDNNITRLGNYYTPDGWMGLKLTTLDNKNWSYVKNGQPVIDDWIYSGNDWYYMGPDSLITTGFYDDGSRLFYLCEDEDCFGKMLTGWQDLYGARYYFQDNGAAKRNEWYTDPDTNITYYFDYEGVMAIGLRYVESNNDSSYYYFSEESSNLGEMQTGWKKIDGDWFFFRNNKINDGGATGSAVKGFKTIDNNTYYFRSYNDDVSIGLESSMISGLATIDDNIYYFRAYGNDISSGPEGSMVTGLASIYNNTYYFREDNNGGPKGSAIKNECKNINNTNYCFNSSGVGSVVTSVNIPTDSICLNPTYDGSSKTLATTGTGYTLVNNEQTNAGDYTVTLRLNNGYMWSDYTNSDKTITCSINKANLPTPSITNYSGTYDGNPHQVSLGNSSGKTVSYSTTGIDYSNTVPTRTDFGTTTVYVKYIGNSNYNDSSVATGTISISKATPVITLSDELNAVTEGYEGKLLSISANTSGIFTFSTSDSNLEIITGPISVDANEVIDLNIRAISTGSANINISFVPSSLNNYDSYQQIKELNVVEQIIVHSVAQIPTASAYCKNNLVYSGLEQTLTNSSGEGYTFINNNGTNAGEYTVTAKLNTNYEWSDGTTSNKTIICNISKIDQAKPITENYNSIYDGSSHQITLSNSDGKTVLYSTDGTNYSSTVPTRTNVGTTNVYVKYAGNQNYNDSEIATGSIVITKATPVITITNEISSFTVGDGGRLLTISSDIAGTFTFVSDAEFIETTTGPSVVTAGQSVDVNINAIKKGAALLSITFIPSNANYNEYNNVIQPTINNKVAVIPTASDYCVTNLVYNGQEKTLTNTPGEGYTFINNKGTNAGEYTITAKLNSNYDWSDNTSADKTIKCSIAKASIGDYTVTDYSGTYDGLSHSVTVSNVNGGTVKYSTDNTNWQTTPITRTDYGTTDLYVYIKGDNNHNDSEVKTGSISVSKAIPEVSIDLIDTSFVEQFSFKELVSMTSPLSGTYYFTIDDNIIDNYPSQIKAAAGEIKTLLVSGYAVGETTLHVIFVPDNHNYQSSAKNLGVIVTQNSSYVVSVPTANSVCLSNIIYNGQEQKLTIDDTDAYEFINNMGTNAGEYNVTVKLKGNYQWSDNSSTDKYVTCSISKANLAEPTITGYSGTYDGNPHYITASSIPGGTIMYSLDNNTFTTFAPSRTDFGNTQVYVKYNGDQNHNDSSVYSTNINITKANSVISSLNLVDTINKGETVEVGPISANVDGVFTVTSTDSSVVSIPVIYETISANETIKFNITGVKVGNTSYTITFTPTSNNYNSSSIITNIEVVEVPRTVVIIPTSTTYCKSNLKYTGSPLTITNNPGEGYTFSNNIQTNVGTHTVTASLLDGYIWSDNTLNDKTFNCEILKADSYLTFNNSLVVNNNFIKARVNPGTTYSQFKSLINTNGTITSSKNDDDVIATCDTVSITLDGETTNYSIALVGDVTKSGTVGSPDVNLLFKYLRNKENLSECQLKASDTTNDNSIFINDVAKLYQFVNGKIGGLND